MNSTLKLWLFRALAAVVGVAGAAVAGVVADAAHFGMFATLIGAVQALLLTVFGNLIRKWEAPATPPPPPTAGRHH